MKTAYASLHTALPNSQSDSEVSYKGYKRIAIDFGDDFGNQATAIIFPKIEEDGEGQITHVCIGENESGDGEAYLTIHSMPYMDIKKREDDFSPRIIVCNIHSDGMPASVNPIARMIYILVMGGEISAESLHPNVFEMVNDEIIAIGFEPMKVTRSGTANMVQTMSWGLSDLKTTH